MKKNFLFILAVLVVVLNSCSSSNPKNVDITKANTSIYTSYENTPSFILSVTSTPTPNPSPTPSQTLINTPDSIT